MTDVTRIACPGCQTSLRFEPEALDFPGNCGACDCRFSTGIYVRVACPKCHAGSKIRESYRGQHVRCVRCRHDFLADEGITPGGGGRLLVARMLDTGQVNPPETIQPFLGGVRVEVERKLALPVDKRVLEADLMRIEAMAERDRMAEEATLFKAIVARLVSNQPEPPLPELNPAVDARESWPHFGSGEDPDETIARLTEERDRFARLAEDRKADLDRIADRPSVDPVDPVDPVDLRGRAEQDEALERSRDEVRGLSTTIERLNRAVASSLAGEAEALQRLGDLAGEVEDYNAVRNVELDFAHRKAQELARIVDGLRLEVKAAREAEADRSTERDEHARTAHEDRSTLVIEHDRARAEAEADRRGLLVEVEGLKAGAETARAEERARMAESLAEAERDRRGLVAEVEGWKAEVEAAREAEAARSTERDEHARAAQQDRSTLVVEHDRARAGAEADRRGLVAEVEGLKLELEATRRQLKEAAESGDRLAEAVDELLEQNQALNEDLDRVRAEARRMAEARRADPPIAPEPEPGPDPAEGLRREVDRLSAALEESRSEADRKRKGLVSDIQRVKQMYAEIVAEKKALVEVIRELSEDRAAPIDPITLMIQEREAHRDLAMTLLYGDDPDLDEETATGR